MGVAVVSSRVLGLSSTRGLRGVRKGILGGTSSSLTPFLDSPSRNWFKIRGTLVSVWDTPMIAPRNTAGTTYRKGADMAME